MSTFRFTLSFLIFTATASFASAAGRTSAATASQPTPPVATPKADAKVLWQNRYHGPDQILTITACTDKGCHYEFRGEPKAPCTDSGQLTFSTSDKQEAKATHRIGMKTCQFSFTMSEEGLVEVDDSCVCNVATDSDLGGDYRKF